MNNKCRSSDESCYTIYHGSNHRFQIDITIEDTPKSIKRLAVTGDDPNA